MPTPLPPDEFDACFERFERSAFRLQLLPAYDVPEEREEYERFLAGAPAPRERHLPWLATMCRQTAQGRTWTTVHLAPTPPAPYFRYLIDWWLVFQAQAGANVRFLRSAHAPEIQPLAAQDFWLFDDARLVLLDYDAGGRFRGAVATTAAASIDAARRARDYALARAIDLPTFLATLRGGRSR